MGRLLFCGATAAVLIACSSKGAAPPPNPTTPTTDAGSMEEMDSSGGVVDSGGGMEAEDASTEDVTVIPCTNDSRCQTTGPQCSGSAIVTCSFSSQGCYVVTATNTCPPNQMCASSGVIAACACVTPTVCNQTGTFCEGSNLLVTCTADVNGCLAVTESTCGAHQTCKAAEGCVCQAAPTECSGAGAACVDSTSLLTCAIDANACVFGTTTTCPSGKACAGSFPDASCE